MALRKREILLNKKLCPTKNSTDITRKDNLKTSTPRQKRKNSSAAFPLLRPETFPEALARRPGKVPLCRLRKQIVVYERKEKNQKSDALRLYSEEQACANQSTASESTPFL